MTTPCYEIGMVGLGVMGRNLGRKGEATWRFLRPFL